jgi:hypothetical protein
VVTDRDRSVVAWIAVIGAVSAQDVMKASWRRQDGELSGASALVDHGLLTRARLVCGQPALYVATRDGLFWAGMPHVDPARVGVATTRDWALCAPPRLAVNLSVARAARCGGSGGYARPSSGPSADRER